MEHHAFFISLWDGKFLVTCGRVVEQIRGKFYERRD